MQKNQKRIAFIKHGSFSHINASLSSSLQALFPQYKLDIIDVGEMLKSSLSSKILNKLAVYREFGLDILSGRKTYASCWNYSQYLHRWIKSQLQERITPEEYIFSIQTQSLFDASVEKVPHFIFTDHTSLANLRYPDVDCRFLEERYPSNWLSREYQIYHNAAGVFTMGDFVRQSLVEDYGLPTEKAHCVGGGSNIAVPDYPNPNQYQTRNILFVGVEWERKGGPELVQAFTQVVLPKHPNARLTIVGCSPELNDIPNCDVVGRIPLEKLPFYYQNAAVFCLPSRREPFGVVFVEAMLNNLPVVATNIGAIPDMIIHGQNGYLVEHDDVAGIGHYLNDLIGTPNHGATLGASGRAYASENFTWHRVGQRIQEQVCRHIGVDIESPLTTVPVEEQFSSLVTSDTFPDTFAK